METREEDKNKPQNEGNTGSAEQTAPPPSRGRGPGGGRDRRDDRGQRGPRGPRGQRDARDESGLDEVVVHIYRCATVVKGGRRFSFAALMVVGDRNGQVGIGYGKATEVPSAVDKARKIASKKLTKIRLAGKTIPHRVTGEFGASRVVLVPASPGTGVIAGGSVRAVLELAGVQDVLTKSYGSNSPKNLVRATFEGLTSMLNPDEVRRLRGVPLAREAG